VSDPRQNAEDVERFISGLESIPSGYVSLGGWASLEDDENEGHGPLLVY
jgi:hypothetical protein